MKKLIICSLISLLSLSCSVLVPNNSTQKTSSPSLLKDNFSDLEREYKSFSTKALSDTYVSRMFNKFLTTSPNATQVIRQLEFARYLKDVKSDTSYFNSLKNFIAADSAKFNLINNTNGVSQKKSAESATFGTFVDSLNPSVVTDAQAFIDAVGISDTNQQNAIKTLVTDLKTYAIWTKMKAIYPFMGGTASTHKWNLKDPRDLDSAFRLTFAGGWIHSATGALPNGSTGYANTHLNASSNLIMNDTHMSYYSRTVNENNVYEMGCYDGTSRTIFAIKPAAGSFDARLNTIANTYPVITYAGDSKAYFIQNKHNSSTVQGYRNNVLLGSVATTSSGPSNCDLYIGARNGGWAEQFSNRETAFATIGDGLTDTDATKLYTAVQKFNTTLNRQVGTPVYDNTITEVTSGLVLNLDAGNTSSYAGSGTTWNDLSGNANNGILVNGVGYNSANGGSLVFDGSSNYASFPDSSSLTLGNNFSFGAWIKTTGNVGEIFSNFETPYPYVGFLFGVGFYTTGKLAIYANNGGAAIYDISDTGLVVNDGNWHYVNATYDGSNVKFYRDGILSSTRTISISIGNSTNTFKVGVSGNSPLNRYFDGNISNVQVFNRALTQTEVLQNYNALKVRYGL